MAASSSLTDLRNALLGFGVISVIALVAVPQFRSSDAGGQLQASVPAKPSPEDATALTSDAYEPDWRAGFQSFAGDMRRMTTPCLQSYSELAATQDEAMSTGSLNSFKDVAREYSTACKSAEADLKALPLPVDLPPEVARPAKNARLHCAMAMKTLYDAHATILTSDVERMDIQDAQEFWQTWNLVIETSALNVRNCNRLMNEAAEAT